jgi:hypothetical protein
MERMIVAKGEERGRGEVRMGDMRKGGGLELRKRLVL